MTEASAEDAAHLARLQEILTDPEPGDDGIDRWGGFGTEIVVQRLRVEPGEHGDELAVDYDIQDADGSRRRACLARVPFDLGWRQASGFETPEAHAPEVARALVLAGGRPAWRERAHQLDESALPPRDEQHRMLLQVLHEHGSAGVVGQYRYELDGLVLVLSADDWELLLAVNEGDLGAVADELAEVEGSGFGTERYVVFWEGALHRSVREQRPPVLGPSPWSPGSGGWSAARA